LPEPPAFPVPPLPTIFTFAISGAVKVPGALKVCEPAGTAALPPKTPSFEVPIGII
jgi:hypothetical protein